MCVRFFPQKSQLCSRFMVSFSVWFAFIIIFSVDFIIHLIVFKKNFHPHCCIHNIQCGIDYDAVEWLGVCSERYMIL